MKNTQDLLHGNIKSELIALTIPLVLGNILAAVLQHHRFFYCGKICGNRSLCRHWRCRQYHEPVYLYPQWWM